MVLAFFISLLAQTGIYPSISPPTADDTAISVRFDPWTERYCIHPTVRSFWAVLPRPACRTAKEWNHSGRLWRDLPEPVTNATATTEMRPAKPVDDMTEWFSASDIPTIYRGKSILAYVYFDLLVGSDGSVTKCAISHSSGYTDLDNQTCAVLVKRGKFFPAQSPDGKKEYGVVHDVITWAWGSQTTDLQRRMSPPTHFDLEVAVSKLPNDGISPVDTGVAVLVDASGANVGCKMADSDPNTALKTIACDQAMKLWKPINFGGSNSALPTVQEVTIRIGLQNKVP